MKYTFVIFLLTTSLVYAAGVVETVHNLEINSEWAGGIELNGVCAYCHIPHSAVGSQIWPWTPREKDYGSFGVVSGACYVCHGTNLAGTRANKMFTVFNVKRANHPVNFASVRPSNVENTITTQGWPGVGIDKGLQCSTCHNPHDNVNGCFIRAPMYDSSRDSTQNFCSFCHQQREDSGSHPVSDSTLCITCHQAHGAEPSRDGLYTDKTPLSAGPLLVMSNDTMGSVPGESLLCEKCHVKMVDTTGNEYMHPVNNFPTPTNDNFSSNVTPYTEHEFGDGKGTPLSIHYPFNETDKTTWVDYEESGDPNTLPANRERTAGEYLVCMSCHDPHGARVGSPILRAGSSDAFCEDCHGRPPRYNDYNNFVNPISEEMGTRMKATEKVWGVSHPINVPMMSRDQFKMSIRDSLVNTEGMLIKDIRSKIKLVDNKVVCRTCHLAHAGSDNYLLAITDNNSELCEACHTDEKQPHNPSVYYFEGLDTTKSKDPVEDFDTVRLGSHYIGDVTMNRNELTAEWVTIKREDHADWLGTAHVNDYRELNEPWSFSRQYTHIGGPEPKYPHVICQSCHTPHGAATGLSDSKDEDRLLLDKNDCSEMCRACHYPPGSHPVMDDILGGKNKPLNIFDSMIIQNEIFMLPCDYPGDPKRLTCESCHSAHSAENSSGAYVLEVGKGNIDKEGGYIYKPTKLDFYPLCRKCHLQGLY